MEYEARARQVAQNESLYRDVNERIEEVSGRWESETASFVCECGVVGCGAMVEVEVPAYEAVRRNPRRFVVYPGHEQLEFERVVEERDGYKVVEKLGRGAEVAEDLDPRSS